MFPVPWCDVLEIVRSDEQHTGLTVTGALLAGPAEKNLCYLAWQLLAEKYGIPPVKIHLHKVVPSGAGLGGGSSDASFTLKMLNSLFNLKLNNDTLRSLAVQLGMDCPFFIENNTALSTGRGEFLKPIPLNLDGYYLVIVKPPLHVSTAAAFSGIIPLARENSIAEFVSLPVEEWKNNLYNDFEHTVFDLYPEIEDIKRILYYQGAVYSAMSGSGSAVYGLFAGKPLLQVFNDHDVFTTLLGSQA